MSKKRKPRIIRKSKRNSVRPKQEDLDKATLGLQDMPASPSHDTYQKFAQMSRDARFRD